MKTVKKTLNLFCKYLVYLFVRIIICFVQSLSLESCERGAACLAGLFTDFIPLRRKILKKNLTNAFPHLTRQERKQLIRKMWKHLFLLACEVALAPRLINEHNWWRHFRLINCSSILRMIHDNRPLIIITGHFGNFELGGYILGLFGYPTFSVARTIDNPFLNQYIKEFRESTGQFLISKNEGYEDILEVLRNNGTMAFLADQSAGPKGCWVKFFDQPASAYKAMALLCIEYDAPMVVCHATRRYDRPMMFDMTVTATLDPRNRPEELTSIKQLTQWFTTSLENSIRQAPDQYWWLHNRWKNYGRKINI